MAPPPLPPALPADDALHVFLTWSAPADLDLYVTDPAGETLYFGNNPTRSGARLDRDARCESGGPGRNALEHAAFAAPVPGRYRVGVDYLQDCGIEMETVAFRVLVGRRTEQRGAVGVAQRGHFNVVVLEFQVGEDGRITGGEP